MSNVTEMTETMELIDMELCYTKLVHATTSVARREFFVNCLSLYKKFPSVKERWAYHPSAHQYKDRFCKRRIPLTKKKKTQPTRVHHCNNSDYYDDRIDYSVPEGCGLYFIGGTRYDRDLQKVIHVVKIGKSTNLPKRMDGYNKKVSQDAREAKSGLLFRKKPTMKCALRDLVILTNPLTKNNLKKALTFA